MSIYSKVAALEKKVEALTAALHDKENSPTNVPFSAATSDRSINGSSSGTPSIPVSINGHSGTKIPAITTPSVVGYGNNASSGAGIVGSTTSPPIFPIPVLGLGTQLNNNTSLRNKIVKASRPVSNLKDILDTDTTNSGYASSSIPSQKGTALPSILSISSQVYDTNTNIEGNSNSQKQSIPTYKSFSNQISHPQSQSQYLDVYSKPAGNRSSTTPSTSSLSPLLNPPSKSSSYNPFIQPENSPPLKQYQPEFDVDAIKSKLAEQWQLMVDNDHIRIEDIKNSERSRSPNINNDAVTQGIISIKEAEYRLQVYKSRLYKVYPLILVPDDVTIDDLRRDSPFLFLTIMSVSSMLMRIDEVEDLPEDKEAENNGSSKSNVNLPNSPKSKPKTEPLGKRSKKAERVFKTAVSMNNQCTDSIMYEIMIVGNKSLELLKCMILVNLWYNTPEMYHHQKAHLITHISITMAFDLGLGGHGQGAASSGPSLQQTWAANKPSFLTSESTSNQVSNSGSRYGSLGNITDSWNGMGNTNINSSSQNSGHNNYKDIKYDRPLRPNMLLDPHSYASRKMWLCVYTCSINVALVIKRPVYMMWSKYTEECCQMLEQPDRPEDERTVSVIARLYHLLEQLSSALQTNDPQTPPNFSDPQTQSLIKYFDWQLQSLSHNMNQLISQTYKITFHAIQLLMYESVLYIPYSPALGRSPYTEYSLAIGVLEITMSSTQAIGNCYYASTTMIEILNNLPLIKLCCLPMGSYLRVVLAVSILLKLRTLYLTVPGMRTVCNVSKQDIKQISILLERFDELNSIYVFANSALNYSLVLRLLVYHYERQLYFYYKDKNKSKTKFQENEQERGPIFAKKDGKLIFPEEEATAEASEDNSQTQHDKLEKNSVTDSNTNMNEPNNNLNGNNALPNTSTHNSFHKRSEYEKDVILFMQKQQDGNFSSMNKSTGPNTVGTTNNFPAQIPTSSGSVNNSTFTQSEVMQPSQNDHAPQTLPSTTSQRFSFSAPFPANLGLNNQIASGNLDTNQQGIVPNLGNFNQQAVYGPNPVDPKNNPYIPTTTNPISTAPSMYSVDTINNMDKKGEYDEGIIMGEFSDVSNILDNETDLPSWLFLDDSWKDLVSNAEALSGFDLFG